MERGSVLFLSVQVQRTCLLPVFNAGCYHLQREGQLRDLLFMTLVVYMHVVSELSTVQHSSGNVLSPDGKVASFSTAFENKGKKRCDIGQDTSGWAEN